MAAANEPIGWEFHQSTLKQLVAELRKADARAREQTQVTRELVAVCRELRDELRELRTGPRPEHLPKGPDQ